MFSRVRIAIRFFFVGLAVGVLLAPRSGEETRKMLREKADSLLNGILDAATLGTAETGTATRGSTSTSAGQVDEEAKAPRTPRSSNGGSGSGRSRSSRSTTSAEASTGSVT